MFFSHYDDYKPEAGHKDRSISKYKTLPENNAYVDGATCKLIERRAKQETNTNKQINSKTGAYQYK